jgi:SAM-dependent methyltransferase
MKFLPTVQSNYQSLHDIITAPIRTRLLMAGIQLSIFDEMTTSRTAEEIAAAIRTHTGNTERFLNALVTIGLVEKKDGRYHNRSETSEFLVKRWPTYIGGLLQMVERMCVAPLDDLVDLVRTGPPAASAESNPASPERWAEATRASAAWVIGGVGTQMATVVAGLPEFPGLRHMLDLGSGHGMFALYFVNAHPTMTGVVFDQPPVVAVAEEFIREYGFKERVSTMAGDYLVDDIGEGYDLIWACATLNFARHDLDGLLAKVHDALNPGGIFISFQDGMTHDRTQPDMMLGHLGDVMLTGRDFFFDQGEIGASMLRCGFRSIQSRTLKTPMGAMDLDIARK